MAIAGIGIEGHIGHDRHAGMGRLNAPDRPGDQAAFVETFGAVFGFEPIGHLGEEHHAANAQAPGATHLLHEPFQAPALGAGHGTNRLIGRALVHKQGVDEIGGAELVLPNHGPQGWRAPQPAGAVGELHGGLNAGRILRSRPGGPRLGRAWQAAWLGQGPAPIRGAPARSSRRGDRPGARRAAARAGGARSR